MESKFYPVLYSSPMVQAIQEDRKTKTRRTRGLEFVNKEPNIYNRNDNPIKSINTLWLFFPQEKTTKAIFANVCWQ